MKGLIFTLLIWSSNSYCLSLKKTIDQKIFQNKKGNLCNFKVYPFVEDGRESPLMKKAVLSVKGKEKKGSVPKSLIFSKENYVSNKVFHTTDEIFSMGSAIIEDAKNEILIQSFLVQKKSIGIELIFKSLRRLQEIIKKEGRPPVTVKFLFDDPVGIARLASPFNETYRVESKKIDLELRGLNPKYLKVFISVHEHHLLGVSHSKSIVVDRSMAIVMGANMIGEHEKKSLDFNDFGYFIRGKAAKGLAEDIRFGLKESELYTSNIDYKIGSRMSLKEGPDEIPTSRLSPYILKLGEKIYGKNKVPILIATRKATHNIFNRWPRNPQNAVFLSLMDNAINNINIITPSLNSSVIIKALIKAAKRGVDLNILLSRQYQDSIANLPFQGGSNKKNARKILKKVKKYKQKFPSKKIGKVKIHWFVDHQGKLSRKASKKNPNKHSSHTKYLSVDNQVTMIGSANLDNQSWYYSRELNLVLDGHELTKKWCNKVFMADFHRGKIKRLKK